MKEFTLFEISTTLRSAKVKERERVRDMGRGKRGRKRERERGHINVTCSGGVPVFSE